MPLWINAYPGEGLVSSRRLFTTSGSLGCLGIAKEQLNAISHSLEYSVMMNFSQVIDFLRSNISFL